MPKKTLILRLDDNADETRLRELLAGEEGVSLEAAEELPEDEPSPERIALLKERVATAGQQGTISWDDMKHELLARQRQHGEEA